MPDSEEGVKSAGGRNPTGPTSARTPLRCKNRRTSMTTARSRDASRTFSLALYSATRSERNVCRSRAALQELDRIERPLQVREQVLEQA